MASGQGSGLSEHLRAAAHGEAWRERVREAAAVPPVPPRRELVGLAQARLEDLAWGNGRVVGEVVHHHLADDGADAVRLGGGEGRIGRVRPDGGVGDDRRRPGRGEGPERGRRLALGGSAVVATLEREDVALEPGQQIEPAPQPRVRQLREVRVEVDHPGHHNQGPDVDDVGWVPGALPRPGRCDMAGRIDGQEAVGQIQQSAPRQGRQQPRPERERWGMPERRRCGHWDDATLAAYR